MRKRHEVTDEARAVLARQDGLIARHQAATCAMSDEVVERLVLRGYWQRLDPGIYLADMAPPTWDHWARGALLWAGMPAALGGEAAAFRHGLVDRPPPVVDVWVPRGSSHRAPRPRWRLRYDSAGRMSRARTRGSLLLASVEDTVIDVANCSDVDRALSVLTRALARQRTHETRLRAVLGHRRRVRHRAVISDVVSERKGYESAMEYHLEIDVLRPHGLPVGRAQVSTKAGRVDRVIDEYALALEADGRVGHEGDGAFRDMDRDNGHTINGLRTLRLGWEHVRLRPCETARITAAVLRGQGWRGSLRPCRRCAAVAEKA